jgi:hypothetical protein
MSDNEYLNIGLLVTAAIVLINLGAFLLLPVIISKIKTFKIKIQPDFLQK